MKSKAISLLLLVIFATTAVFSQPKEKLTEQTRTLLKGVKFYDNPTAQQVQHHIYFYQISQNLAATAAVTTSKDIMCMDCPTYLSVFVFKNIGNKWQLTEKKLKLAIVGLYGNYPLREEINFTAITPETFLLYYETLDNKNNIEYAYITTYYFDGKKLYPTGNVMIGQDNSSAISKTQDLHTWEAEYTITKGPGNLPKIILDIQGYKGINQYKDRQVYILNPKDKKFRKI